MKRSSGRWWYVIPIFLLLSVPLIWPVLHTLNQQLPDTLQRELEKTFGRPVKIRKAQWLVPSTIYIEGLEVNRLKVPEAYFQFGLFSLLRHTRDPGKALAFIRLVKPEIKMVMTPDGQILSPFATGTEADDLPPPKIRIHIVDGLLILTHPSQNMRLDNFHAQIDLKNFPSASLAIQGNVKGTALIDFPVSSFSGQIRLQVQADNLTQTSPGFTGQISLGNGKCVFYQQEIRDIHGSALLSPEAMDIQELRGEYFGVRLSGSGKQKIQYPFDGDFEIAAAGTLLGQSLNIQSTLQGSLQEVGLRIQKGRWGTARWEGSLRVEDPAGEARTEGIFSFEKVNLAALSQNIPGIEGTIASRIQIKGPFQNLTVTSQFSSENAMLFGQSVREGDISAIVQEGELYVKNLLLTSPGMSFSATGGLSRKLFFALKTESRGVVLRGATALGEAVIHVANFSGTTSGQLSAAFFVHPLKYLSAEGKINIHPSEVGKQRIEAAEGEIILEKGKLSVENLRLQNASTVIHIQGTSGVGEETLLHADVENGRFEDLPLLSEILPDEWKTFSGAFSATADIEGDITEEIILNPRALFEAVHIRGKLDTKNAVFLSQNTQELQADVEWTGSSLHARNLYWKAEKTTLEAKGKLEMQGKSDFTLRMQSELSALRGFSPTLRGVDGYVDLSSHFEGTVTEPKMTGEIELRDVLWKNTRLEKLDGPFILHNGVIQFPGAVNLIFDANHVQMQGSVQFTTQPVWDVEATSLTFNIRKGRAESLIALYQKVEQMLPSLPYYNYGKRMRSPHVTLRSRRRLMDYAEFVKDGWLQIFRQNGASFRTLLQEFEEDYAQPGRGIAPAETASPLPLTGDVLGTIRLGGKVANPTAEMDLRISDGRWSDFSFGRISTQARIENGEILISSLEIHKEDGKISASGKVTLPDTGEIKLLGSNFPAQVLTLIFPNGVQKWGGTIDTDITLSGKLDRPILDGGFTGKKIEIFGTRFDRISGKFIPKKGAVVIEKGEIREGGFVSTFRGGFPYAMHDAIQLDGNFRGQSIALLNLFTHTVEKLSGNTEGEIHLRGTMHDPRLSGKLTVQKGTAYLPGVDMAISQIDATLSIENSIIAVEKCTGIWKGARTMGRANAISLAGVIDIGNAMHRPGTVPVNLELHPETFWISYPGLVEGKVDLQKLEAKGDAIIEWQTDGTAQIRGPTLHATLALSQASVRLPDLGEEKTLAWNPKLNVVAHVPENVRIVGGDAETLISTDLTQFFANNIILNIEVAGENIRISETLQTPTIVGNLNIERGSVNILGNEFVVVTSVEQEVIFEGNPQKQMENRIRWSGGVGREGAIPFIQTVAKLETVDLSVEQKPITILAHIQGMPFVTDPEFALQPSFSPYEKVREEGIVRYQLSEEYSRAGGGERLKVLLLPDAYKTLLGVAGESAENINVNQVLGDYLNTRFQALFLRGFERDLEERLGLQSFNLEYNIGRDVTQLLGSSAPTLARQTDRERSVGVGFVKNFFGRFYVDVRYRQLLEETGSVPHLTSVNYQLTYKLSPTFSLIFYREPFSNTGGAEETYYKLTLRGTERF